MSRVFNKLKDGGARLFNKLNDAAPRLLSRLHDGISRGSGMMNSGSNFLNKVGDIANRVVNNPGSVALASTLGVAPQFLAGGNALIGATRIGSKLLRDGQQQADSVNNALERAQSLRTQVIQGPSFA